MTVDHSATVTAPVLAPAAAADRLKRNRYYVQKLYEQASAENAGHIIKGVAKQLGMRWKRQTFSDPAAGKAALDAQLDKGHAVGLQTCVYWLPYFPEDMRFHFNAHNLVVVVRKDQPLMRINLDTGEEQVVAVPVAVPERVAARMTKKKLDALPDDLAAQALLAIGRGDLL